MLDDVDVDERRKARGAWNTRRFAGRDDGEEIDAAYWLALSMDERAEAAWQLSLEQWSMLEPETDHERRLPRPALRVERR